VSYGAIKSGSVIFYPYLWHHEALDGETSGRKHRRTAVGARLTHKGGRDALILFPITTLEPPEGKLAVEVPETEKQRAGLDRSKRLWIILDEYNYDEVGYSFYLEPADPIGQFSVAFFDSVLQKVKPALASLKRISRVE